MSYTIYPYLVDLEQLRRVYGARRMDLLAEIERQFGADISERDEDDFEMTPAVRESLGDDYDFRAVTPTVREALSEIVSGELQPTEYTQQYGYALEFLCKYLGAPLSNDSFENVTTKGLGIVLNIDGLKPGTHAVKPPIPLATWPPPTLTCLTSADAADLLARFEFIEPPETNDEEDRVWVKSVQEQYQSWLRESIRTQKALVAFLE